MITTSYKYDNVILWLVALVILITITMVNISGLKRSSKVVGLMHEVELMQTNLAINSGNDTKIYDL